MKETKHKKTIQEYYSKRAVDYDRQKIRTWNSRQGFGDQVFSRLIDSLTELKDKAVLEVCIGSGRTSLPLLKRVKSSLIGLDFSKEMLKGAKAKTREFKRRTELILGDAENLPFTDGTFDALICTSAMHYFDHPIRNLTEFSRTLQKGSIFAYGDLTLHNLDRQRFLDRLERTASLVHGSYYKPSEIVKMLENTGFHISEVVTFSYRKPLTSLMEDKGRYFGVKPEALQRVISNASDHERQLYSISDNELTLFYTLIKALKE